MGLVFGTGELRSRAVYSAAVAITASELRRNIYKLLDQVIETGVPLEIKRGDHILRISTTLGPTKLENLPLRNLFSCDPDSLVNRPLGQDAMGDMDASLLPGKESP